MYMISYSLMICCHKGDASMAPYATEDEEGGTCEDYLGH